MEGSPSGVVVQKRGKLTATFGDIVISSNFDSGNLDNVDECKPTSGIEIKEFNLYTAPDCAGTEYENPNRTWFYFSVTTPPNFNGNSIRLNIQNLNKQCKLYQQGLTPIVKTVPGRGTWERLRERPEFETAAGGGLRLSFLLSITDSRKVTTYCAFCFPYSYTECQRRLSRLDDTFGSDGACQRPGDGTMHQKDRATPNMYYHRELLCQSLEGRRIDLITVSSYDDITEEREPRLLSLFPDLSTVRARVFHNKKVVFVSSRVHPGETPSSYVFNGFLQFILKEDDPRAQTLRKHFVFKLIPMLNPDGVYQGHYRTDTRGVNLNRMYLNPCPDLHPSVYGAKMVMLHHHKRGGTSSNVSSPQKDKDENESSTLSRPANSLESSKLLALSEQSCSCVCTPDTEVLNGWCNKHTTGLSSHSLPSIPSVNHNNNNSCRINSRVQTNNTHFQVCEYNNNSPNMKRKLSSLSYPITCNSDSKLSTCTTTHNHHLSLNTNPAEAVPLSNHSNAATNDATSAICESDSQPDAIAITKQSGIALYVDLHAHATKRGIFMYGNYFNNHAEQADNMLLPKLVSLNSPHLDFEHCTFSEKNMYAADKRDGLSKEGSGRVAIYKAMGFIHSYTLECNYNSSKQSNPVTAATMDGGRASPPIFASPMGHRFSVQDFEQVGRALGIALLDLYLINPWSRLPTTTFGSVAGVRQSLVQRICNSRAKKAKSKTAAVYCDDKTQEQEPTTVSATTTCGPGSIAVAKNSSAHVSKTLLVRRQRRLAETKRSVGQIAQEIAQMSESKRREKGESRTTVLVQLAKLKRNRPESSRRQHVARQVQARTSQVAKPSLHQVVFPTGSTVKVNSNRERVCLYQRTTGGDLSTNSRHFCSNTPTSKVISGVHSQPISITTFPPAKLQKKRLMDCRPHRLLMKRATESSLITEELPVITKQATEISLTKPVSLTLYKTQCTPLNIN